MLKQYQSNNFHFLEKEFPFLYNLVLGAEYNLYQDPNVCLFKLRQFVERLTDTLFNEHMLDFPYNNTVANRIKALEQEGILPDTIINMLFSVNRKGNLAAHQIQGTTNDGLSALLFTFKIAKWLYDVYGNGEINLTEHRFSKPADRDARHAYHVLSEEYKELEKKFEKLLAERSVNGLPKEREEEIKVKSKKVASKIRMNEAETRELIDAQLLAAGWEVNTENINYKKHKTLPERGKNKAIAEWKVGNKWADYALFIGLELFGIIEAKKYAQDISSDITQAKVYATLAETKNEAILLGQWQDYKVPFLFSTNGRKYLEQIKTKSGIWFLDVRNQYNNSRCLKGWYSPDGLRKLYEQNLAEAEEKLKTVSLEFLQSKKGLSLRNYQIEAIKAIEYQLINNPDRQKFLLAMATGTGKTRTSIGLSYRLISSDRFRRILFLVDRRLLARQAFDDYKDKKVIDTNTFSTIYKMIGIGNKEVEEDTRLQFATVQSMVKRLFYNNDGFPDISVDQYDCIIVDEAHRGYLLDKELDDEEINFKNQDEYVSQYRRVIEYFDCKVIGLTATPALHTIEIFGRAVFNYTYREAVIDGNLIDHDQAIPIRTELGETGIVWERGEKPKALDAETNEIIELEALEDDLHIEIEQFNKLVITESFNREVIKFLVNELDHEGEEKTLIFASREDHAALIVNLLNEEFKNIGFPTAEGAIEQITGSHYNAKEALRRFKNEKYPNIVVTVDLLTTGIDVPQICNLVFLRRVKSRMLYDQMVGRATRKCDEIGKDVFKIYDAVRQYEALQNFTSMRPVTVNPTATFTQLAEELNEITSEERTIQQVEQIIAKIQRKKRNLQKEDREKVDAYTDDRGLDAFIDELREMNTEQVKQTIADKEKLWQLLDRAKPVKKYQLYSEHEDKLLTTDPNVIYGDYEKPEDYISGFEQFVNENKNKIAALKIVVTSPTQLDRKSLRELRLILDEQGFKSKLLNKAWKDTKNEDIAADIISYIRTLMLGTDLIDHETRIKNAVEKIRSLKKWNKIQSKWIDRFEKVLMENSILQHEDLQGPPFDEHGGFERIDKVFGGELKVLIKTINENLYGDVG